MSENSLPNNTTGVSANGKFNLVFVWNGDRRPDDHKVSRLAEKALPIKFAHVSNIMSAETIFNQNSTSYAEILHSTSVPQNALTYFGGKVVR